jgi:hypothetical protein
VTVSLQGLVARSDRDLVDADVSTIQRELHLGLCKLPGQYSLAREESVHLPVVGHHVGFFQQILSLQRRWLAAADAGCAQ